MELPGKVITDKEEPPRPPSLIWPPALLRLRRILREAITNNIYLKLLSFMLAVVLWALVAEEENVEESAEVYLDLERPGDLVLLNPPPQTLAIRVIGSRSKLKHLRETRLELPVDLSRAKPGEMVYNFVGQRIRNLPGGVEVVAYSPASLKLEFDERMRRKLPVRAQLDGEPGAGYQLGQVEVEPASLTIEGPRGEVKNLRELLTEPVKIDDLRKPYQGRHRVLIDGRNSHVVGGSEEVQVRVAINPVIDQRQFDEVSIVVPETFGKHVLTPSVAKVLLEGPKDVLDTIKPSDVRIFLQEGAVPPGATEESITLKYPDQGEGKPRLTISWPQENVVKLKRLVPSTFQFKVLRGGAEPASGIGERRGRK